MSFTLQLQVVLCLATEHYVRLNEGVFFLANRNSAGLTAQLHTYFELYQSPNQNAAVSAAVRVMASRHVLDSRSSEHAVSCAHTTAPAQKHRTKAENRMYRYALCLMHGRDSRSPEHALFYTCTTAPATKRSRKGVKK